VSDRLGHASVAFTLTTYTAAVPQLQRDAADTLAALVNG
jgi:integrase